MQLYSVDSCSLVSNEVHESQHTLTLPLDSRLNPGMFMSNAEGIVKDKDKLIETLQILVLCWALMRFIGSIRFWLMRLGLRILGLRQTRVRLSSGLGSWSLTKARLQHSGSASLLWLYLVY